MLITAYGQSMRHVHSKHTRIQNNKQIIVSGNCVQRNMQGYQLDQ